MDYNIDKNKIYFVGAGPGAVDLITVRGMKLIEAADIIIYAGSLVNPQILEYNTNNAEIFNSAGMTLDEVICVMKSGINAHKLIVRLHTGDPSIYGAVREQMDELDRLHINYESCPGVSAAFGAAAALNLEYTLPDVSQSLILTRMEGRTSVPDKESIESFATHNASMAIYLSAGMLYELSERLISGGYKPDTPAAIVYKATWPEQKIINTTIADIGKAGEEAKITKTAIVLVGNSLLGNGYKQSRLYAPDFSTEYRKGITNTKIVCFTNNGYKVAMQIAQVCENSTIFYKSKNITEMAVSSNNDVSIPATEIQESIGEWTKKNFTAGDFLIFIGAAGIAVRAIAPQVGDKLLDPGVIVIDEKGTNVIPILSGHYGGANELAVKLADYLGANAIISTASDLNETFAIDLFAKENNLSISDRSNIAKVNAKALLGKPITLKVINPDSDIEADATIKGNVSFSSDLYAMGLGCKRNTSLEVLEAVIKEVLATKNLSIDDIGCIASIDIKADEKCLLDFSSKNKIPFVTFDAKTLMSVDGDFSHSDFVMDRVGCDNVCERSAACAAGQSADLIVEKYAKNGVTVAVAGKR